MQTGIKGSSVAGICRCRCLWSLLIWYVSSRRGGSFVKERRATIHFVLWLKQP